MLLVDDSIRFRPRQYVSAVLMCCRYLLFAISGYRLRRQPANTCHRHRQIVLCSTTSDSECLALSSTTRPADTNPCFGCQQGRLLLLLRAGRCLWSSTRQAACSPSSTLPPDSCSQPGAPNASPCFSVTFIICGSWNRFNSVSAFWHSLSQWISAAISC